MHTVQIMERRANIAQMILAIVMISIPVCGLFYGIMTSGISWDSFNIKNLFSTYIPVILLGIGSILCLFKILELFYKFIFPQNIVLSANGICINKKRLINWDNIDDVYYLNFKNMSESIFGKMVIILLLIVTLRFETLVKIFMLQTIMNQQYEYGGTIIIKLINGKRVWLSIDENLCFKELLNINETKNYIDIVTQIKNYRKNL